MRASTQKIDDIIRDFLGPERWEKDKNLKENPKTVQPLAPIREFLIKKYKAKFHKDLGDQKKRVDTIRM